MTVATFVFSEVACMYPSAHEPTVAIVTTELLCARL